MLLIKLIKISFYVFVDLYEDILVLTIRFHLIQLGKELTFKNQKHLLSFFDVALVHESQVQQSVIAANFFELFLIFLSACCVHVHVLLFCVFEIGFDLQILT